MSKQVHGAAALLKGISVLRSIAAEEQPPVFTRLLSVTGLPKGTLHRILQALISEGLVRFERKDKTYHLADGEFFDSLKSGCVFINASRGGVMDSESLKDSIRSQHLAGAVLDVWENVQTCAGSQIPPHFPS